jgi:large subunit ribosomal protein L21
MLRFARRRLASSAAASAASPHAVTMPASGAHAVSPAANEPVAKSLEGDKFAVIWVTNLQYKVTAGDVIMVQRLRAEIGSSIALKKVMMVGGARFTAIGRPFLDNARVVCDVEEQNEGQTVISLSMPRMRFLDWKTKQHEYTVLRVRQIDYEPSVVGELGKYTGNLATAAAARRRRTSTRCTGRSTHRCRTARRASPPPLVRRQTSSASSELSKTPTEMKERKCAREAMHFSDSDPATCAQ